MSSKHTRSESGQSHGHHPSSLSEALVHSINPFAVIGSSSAKESIALSEDGVPTKSRSGTSKEHAAAVDDADSDGSAGSNQATSRRRGKGTLRSLSPFRFHSSSRRSSSRTRLRVSGNVDNAEDDNPADQQQSTSDKGGKRDWEWGGYWRRRSRRNSDDTVTSANSTKRAETHDTDEVETEREGHMGSWTRICPRNTAFSSGAANDDSEDTEEEGELGGAPPRLPPKDAPKPGGKSDELASEAADSAGAAEESEEEEESDIDEVLLDNTLFNAGCLDLHNDWREAHEYGEHRQWVGYDEDGIARPELMKDQMYCDEPESLVPYADPNHIGDVPIPDEADHLLNAPNLVLSPSQLRRDPCGTTSLITPSPPATAASGAAGASGERSSLTSQSTPQNAFDAAMAKGIPSSTSASSSSASNPATAASGSSASTNSIGDAGRRPIAREGTLTSFMGGQLGEGDRALRASRPVFERNRCTITLLHGQYEDKLAQSKRPKRYVVASDGSAEALYAIEWTIGTVMRDGDETMIVSVMETDTKLDAVDHVFEDKQTRMQHQKIRQDMALVLARQATNLLQRTRLGVKVVCQALHATNSRRMLIDLTDYFSPTLLIVGSRGIGSLKGILLGSTSHYLLQKSSVPVMVARRRLRLPALPRGKADVVQSVRRRHLRLDEASIDKETPPTPEDEAKAQSEAGAETGKDPDKTPTDGEVGSAEDGKAPRSSVDTGTETESVTASSSSASISRESATSEEGSAQEVGEKADPDEDKDGGDLAGRGRSRSRD
ncbi:hypothetical protein OC834_001316 [Tilletia horrida]|uniref:UspA domain-containing protein n=1 Tax=Tilletia horrida TaxID=155126 RepID=A0AAN6JL36_9BASI|nr:hypothetical protein OC842_003532 [Tilletia horrida]KAK0536058.1 hypothetical protein OC834_001316 [Tilletia horrida]